MHLIMKLFFWNSQRKLNKERKKNLELQKKQRAEFYNLLKKLYGFTQWLNSHFANRHTRKDFWRNCQSGEPVMEKVLDNLIKQYTELKQ